MLYRVLTLAGEKIKGKTLNKTTDDTALNTTLEDLQNYAVYEIRVLAFTVKGDGAASQSITAGTLSIKNIVKRVNLLSNLVFRVVDRKNLCLVLRFARASC